VVRAGGPGTLRGVTSVGDLALELLDRLTREPRAEVLLELARVGLGDLAVYERCGGDGVGTDAYEVVRDGWPRYLALLDHDDAEVRLAAGYLLAFLIEPAAQTLPGLRRAAGSGAWAAAGDGQGAGSGGPAAGSKPERVSAGLLLAAARLEACVAAPDVVAGPGSPRNALTLDAVTAEASPLIRGVIALGRTFALPPFGRHVRREVAQALSGLAGRSAGPWGGGDLGELAGGVLASVWVDDDASHSRTFAGDLGDESDESGDASGCDASGSDESGSVAGEGDFGEDDVDDPYTRNRPNLAAPSVKLTGLHEVAWGSLEHAYGPAGGVPGMLESLSSPAEEDRAWALDALEACIHHQGSVFSASSAAVPFLIELAGCDGVGRPAVADRHGILVLLAGLAVHQPSSCLVEGARRWQSEAFAAVAGGGATYVRLLADPDPRVRTGAAFVLSFVEPPAPDALAALRSALAVEPDRRARSSLLLATGYLSRYLARDDDRAVLTGYLDDPCRLIRVSAAVGLYQLCGLSAADTGRAALDVLDEARRNARPVHGFWPWHDGSSVAHGGDLREVVELVRVSAKTLPELLADLEAATSDGDRGAAQATADKALWMLFDDDAHDADHPWLPSELDTARRTVLEYFLAVTEPDSGSATTRTSMPYWYEAADLGLPGDLESTRRLLGTVTGPLDRQVVAAGAGLPVWAVVYGVLVGTLPPDVLHAALAELTASTRVDIVQDALTAPYWLHQQRRHIGYGTPGGPETANDYTSRFILLIADVLVDVGEAGLVWARDAAAEQRTRGKDRDVVRSLVAALVLARAAAARGATLDAEDLPLLALDQPPAGTYLQALRAVMGLLPEPHREHLLTDQLLYGYVAYRDPRGVVRRWRNQDGWDLVDLLPPTTTAERVLAAVQEWERHHAAGDDPGAVPLIGTVTSSDDDEPPPDEPFPHERAIEVLGRCGACAVAAIDAALAGGRITDRALLEQARTLAEQSDH
jgi:HEAT repeat protein